MGYWRLGYRLVVISILLLLGAVTVLIVNGLIKLRVLNLGHLLIVSQYWYKTLIWVIGVRLTITGSASSKGALLVSNHLSWLDIVVVGAFLPVHFLSKSEIRRWPVIGFLAAMVGTLFIHRGAGGAEKVRDEMAAHLQNGHNILFFPEGTTGDGVNLRVFQPRLFASAIMAKKDVIPLSIEYIDVPEVKYIGDQSFVNNALGLLGRKIINIQLKVGETVATDGLQRKEVAAKAQKQVADLLNYQSDQIVRFGLRSAQTGDS